MNEPCQERDRLATIVLIADALIAIGAAGFALIFFKEKFVSFLEIVAVTLGLSPVILAIFRISLDVRVH